PFTASSSSRPAFSRFLWLTQLPLPLSAREFHELLHAQLALPDRPSRPRVKSYVYSAKAGAAYIVCASVEQALLTMLRLRSLLRACVQPSDCTNLSPSTSSSHASSTAPPPAVGPLFAFGRKLRPDFARGLLQRASC